jgi:hypothetical protein
MRAIAIVIVGASFVAACGGIAHRDREAPVDDAGHDAADGGERIDRPLCIHPTPHFVSDAGPTAACNVDGDCPGAATCQGGVCCAGELRGGACRCGDGPGCDPQGICCVPRGAKSTTPSCVKSLSSCGAW